MEQNPLGKSTNYDNDYSSELLFHIPRAENRKKLIHLAKFGYDLWRAYEFSWLNENKLPQIAILEINAGSDSLNIIESKSLKLYLNSFNLKRFTSEHEVLDTLEKDLTKCIDGKIELELFKNENENEEERERKRTANTVYQNTLCIDSFSPDGLEDFEDTKPELLKAEQAVVNEPIQLYSNLFRSLCPVTGQPDWASIYIKYSGKKIVESSLLAYVISYRKHKGFHEDCVELIFDDILTHCQVENLSVYAAFTRRGGIDINPFRSNFEENAGIGRVWRQ